MKVMLTATKRELWIVLVFYTYIFFVIRRTILYFTINTLENTHNLRMLIVKVSEYIHIKNVGWPRA